MDLWNNGLHDIWAFAHEYCVFVVIGSMEQWNNGSMEQWIYGTMDRWNNGSLEQCFTGHLQLIRFNISSGATLIPSAIITGSNDLVFSSLIQPCFDISKIGGPLSKLLRH